MIGIFFVNMVFTIVCWLVLCFAMPDVDAALEHISTYPVIYIMEQSMSTKWVTVELVLIVALVLFANVCYITAVSRDLWAFARDNGVPFSPWISKVQDSQRFLHVDTIADLLRSDPSQIPGTCQRNLRHCTVLILVESHLHRLGDSVLRYHFSLHSRALAVLHVLHRLNFVAPYLSARHHSRI